MIISAKKRIQPHKCCRHINGRCCICEGTISSHRPFLELDEFDEFDDFLIEE